MARPAINDTRILKEICFILAKDPNLKFIKAFRKALESHQGGNNHSEDSFRHRIQRKYNNDPRWKLLTQKIRKTSLEERRVQTEKHRQRLNELLKPRPQTIMRKLIQEDMRSFEMTTRRNIKMFGVADLNDLFKKTTHTDQILISLMNDKK